MFNMAKDMVKLEQYPGYSERLQSSTDVPVLLLYQPNIHSGAVIWTLIGLVIISVLVGALATILTSVTVEHPIILYGAKVNYR